MYNVVKLYLDKRFSNNIKTEFYAYNGEVDDIYKSFIVANQHRSVCLIVYKILFK